MSGVFGGVSETGGGTAMDFSRERNHEIRIMRRSGRFGSCFKLDIILDMA